MNTTQKEAAKALVAEFVRRGLVRFPTPTGDRLISTAADLELERDRQEKEREAINHPKPYSIEELRKAGAGGIKHPANWSRKDFELAAEIAQELRERSKESNQ